MVVLSRGQVDTHSGYEGILISTRHVYCVANIILDKAIYPTAKINLFSFYIVVYSKMENIGKILTDDKN